MKVEITLDYVNGEKSKTKTMDLDGSNLNQLAFMLGQRGVIGCTITKKNVLRVIDMMQCNELSEDEKEYTS